MILDFIYQFLGQFIVFIIIAVIIVCILALILGYVLLKKDKLIFPRFILVILEFFYSPTKLLAKTLNFDETIVDHIGVEVRNSVNRKKFDSIPPEKKLIFLPHCLRHRDCEAVLNETGLVCTCCGKCSIGVIKKKAEPMGYKIYIVPGSSFVKKIVKENKFEAVLGVACYEDLNIIMTTMKDYYPQGVLLSRTGCFETKVDVKSVLEKIGYYKKDDKKLN